MKTNGICKNCGGPITFFENFWYHNDGVDGTLVMPCFDDGDLEAEPVPDGALFVDDEEVVDGTCKHCGDPILNIGNNHWLHPLGDGMAREDCYEMLSLTKAEPVAEGYIPVVDEFPYFDNPKDAIMWEEDTKVFEAINKASVPDGRMAIREEKGPG